MSIFNFNQEEVLTFFAVLVRFSVLFAILPFIGDRFIPTPVKILLSLGATIALFPALISRGQIHPGNALVWGASAGGIVGTIVLEAVFALILGFVARMAFDAIQFSGHLVGNFMGFAVASTYDPHQETQSQVVAQLQSAIAMLIFLAVDGHHVMLRASLDSYRFVGLGGAGFIQGSAGIGSALSQRLVQITSEVLRLGIELAAPVAISLFAVNVVFGVLSKAMPQLNILVLSFAVTALVGLIVLMFSLPEFTGAVEVVFSKMTMWMESVMLAIGSGK